MQREIRNVEAEIAARTADADAVRRSLANHRAGHDTVVSQLNERLRATDAALAQATRPSLLTASRAGTVMMPTGSAGGAKRWAS